MAPVQFVVCGLFLGRVSTVMR